MRYIPSGNQSGGGRIDYRDPSLNGPFYPGTTRQEFRDDPNWRYQHTPGSDRGAHTGFKAPKPSVGGPVTSAADEAAWEEMIGKTHADARAKEDGILNGFPGYAEAKQRFDALNGSGSREERDARRALERMRTEAMRGYRRQTYIDQFGNGNPNAGDIYDNRLNTDWPKPRSPLGAYSHGPGSADWDTRFTNSPPPGTIGTGASTGGDTGMYGQTMGGSPMGNGGAGGIEGYLGAGGMGAGGGGALGPGKYSSSGYLTPQMKAGYARGTQYGGNGMMVSGQGGAPVGNGGAGGVEGYGGMGGGGAGQVYGGQGGQFGQYGGGQSKSGMGQSPYGGGMVSGNAYFGPDIRQSPAGMYDQQYGGGMGGSTMGYGQNPYMLQGGGMQGGYTPFNGGNFSMPYDQFSGMGYW